MICTNNFFPIPETANSIEQDLKLFEDALREFGYPKRAKHLVEYIESQNKGDGFQCYVEYVIGFAVRKKVREIEEVFYPTNEPGIYLKNTELVVKFVKEIRTRTFYSKLNLL